jgi:tRNA(Ile)-lysidine synthase
MGPVPAIADVRHAVRDSLERIAADAPGSLVLVACSGGADSLALAAAVAFESSAGRAAAVAATMSGLGLEPVVVATVDVVAGGGPEAAARVARYEALDAAAQDLAAVAVLFGHTLDDQAETVLLGLARGSGGRSLAGMSEASGVDGHYRRPLLGISRATTEAACAAAGLSFWTDPHNLDPAFARVRVRVSALPALERALGPGVAAALARTADLLRDDSNALDDWAGRAYAELAISEADAGVALDGAEVAALPAAIRRRVLRLAALAAGTPSGALMAAHLLAVDALITDWHGQGDVALPGGRTASRRYGKLTVSGPPRAEHHLEGQHAWTSPTSEPISSRSC